MSRRGGGVEDEDASHPATPRSLAGTQSRRIRALGRRKCAARVRLARTQSCTSTRDADARGSTSSCASRRKTAAYRGCGATASAPRRCARSATSSDSPC